MESKRVKRGGNKVMCIGKDEVRGNISDALDPIQSLLGAIQKKMEGIVTLSIKHTELEGQILHLAEKSKDREKFEDELFNRVRSIEGMTEPRSSCSAIFNNLDKGQDVAVKAIGALDKQIKDRTWAIVVILLGAFLSVMGSVTVGLFIWFVRSGAGA